METESALHFRPGGAVVITDVPWQRESATTRRECHLSRWNSGGNLAHQRISRRPLRGDVTRANANHEYEHEHGEKEGGRETVAA
jgi:hypothetical protein